MLLNRRFAPIFRELNNKKNAARRDWTVKLLDVLAGMATIRLFGLHDKMHDEYCQTSDASARATINRGNAHSNLETGNAVMGHITFVLVIITGTFLVLQGNATFGTVVAVTQLLSGVHELFTQAGGFFALTQRSLASALRLYEVLDAPEEPAVNTSYHPVTPFASQDAAVSVRNACFSYDMDNPILSDISLEVPRGAMVAIVGPSGGGKSTLIKLILGYYPLTSGSISILGASMNDIPLAQLRKRIAYVSQESYLFQGTIYDNIAFGNPDATKEDIIKAVKQANAYDFIQEQPQGFNTPVGERGSHLSGGQRQRVAIARAFIKDAPILLLDEATASLDSQNEAAVQAAITRLMQNRTTLVIAHRLSTIENADNIVVIDGGHIVEQGNHQALLVRNGTYANLHHIQFQQQEFQAEF
jgi:ABC-type multidrug transport system fused ATPase/permease subunit